MNLLRQMRQKVSAFALLFINNIFDKQKVRTNNIVINNCTTQHIFFILVRLVYIFIYFLGNLILVKTFNQENSDFWSYII